MTPGDVIDFGQLETDLLDMTKQFQVREIAYDPWQATQLATRLQQQGATVIEFRQTVANFSEPTKELDSLMRSGKIAHDDDPVRAWMVGNVVGHSDAKENCQRRRDFAVAGRSKSAARTQARRPPISGAFLLVAVHS